jgi:hypothetical protein
MKRFNLKNSLVAVAVLGLSLGVFASSAHAQLNTNWSLLKTDKFCPHRPGCHEYLHKVFLKAGVTYRIDMMSNQFDSYLILENMNGQVLAQNDDGGIGLNARILFTPTVAGNYNVVATPFNKGATGSYTVSVSPLNGGGPPPIQPPVQPPVPQGPTLNINWSLLKTDKFCPRRPGCHEYLHKVFLKAGVTYKIDMMSNQIDSYLFVENMNGQVLAQNDDGGNGLNARIFFTPTVSGHYNVVATTFNQGATGGYTLTVTP